MKGKKIKDVKNPHMHMTRLEKGKDSWRCELCGSIDTLLGLRRTECSHVYPPCEWCGQTPECALDCVGIKMAFSEALGKGAEIIGSDKVYDD